MEDWEGGREEKETKPEGQKRPGPTRSPWTDYQDAIFRVWLLYLPFVWLRRGAKRAAKSRV